MSDPLEQLPSPVTKEQAFGWSQEEMTRLVACVNAINQALLESDAVSRIVVTDMQLYGAVGGRVDLLGTKWRRAIVEHYRGVGWMVQVEDEDRGTSFIFS